METEKYISSCLAVLGGPGEGDGSCSARYHLSQHRASWDGAAAEPQSSSVRTDWLTDWLTELRLGSGNWIKKTAKCKSPLEPEQSREVSCFWQSASLPYSLIWISGRPRRSEDCRGKIIFIVEAWGLNKSHYVALSLSTLSLSHSLSRPQFPRIRVQIDVVARLVILTFYYYQTFRRIQTKEQGTNFWEELKPRINLVAAITFLLWHDWSLLLQLTQRRSKEVLVSQSGPIID